MKKEDFVTGKEFYTVKGKWRCTDIGSRVIVAIQLNQEDSGNYAGPPYSIPEHVFDEYDMEGCSLNPADVEKKSQTIEKSQKFLEIEDAFMFVNSSGYNEHQAIIDKFTGKFYYYSEYIDEDELEQLPEEEYDPEVHIHIPHKTELDLGRDLVFEFVEKLIPAEYHRVEKIFRKHGAYSRYKDLLDDMGLLQKWYDFENRRVEAALRKWCQENEIDMAD